MGVITENDTSQMGKVAPPRFGESYSELASIIFGSNSEALAWAAKYVDINTPGVATELCRFNSYAPEIAHRYTHPHTHTLQ